MAQVNATLGVANGTENSTLSLTASASEIK